MFPVTRHNFVTGRAELVDKDELFAGNPLSRIDSRTKGSTFRIQAYTFGYTRDLGTFSIVETGVGANVTAYAIPAAIQPYYGDHPWGVNFFLRLRLKHPSRKIASMSSVHFTRAVPVISATDVAATVAYFEKTLGFQQQWVWGEPPVYAGVKAGDAQVYVCHDPQTAAAIRDRHLAPDLFLWVRDIDTVYRQHQSNGAEIVEALTERPWGVRQYVVQEPNGYRLKIAEPLEPTSETAAKG